MKVALIRWKDALAVEGDANPAEAKTVELMAIGFLLDENKDAVLIGMEYHTENGVIPGRWRLNIPRHNIREMRVLDEKSAFPKRSLVWES